MKLHFLVVFISGVLYGTISLTIDNQHHQTELSHNAIYHQADNQKIKENDCSSEDLSCWLEYFTDQIDCDNQDDEQCWQETFDDLDCTYADSRCWYDNIYNFPCYNLDEECLNQIFPQTAPCRFGKNKCWQSVLNGDTPDPLKQDPRDMSYIPQQSSDTDYQLERIDLP